MVKKYTSFLEILSAFIIWSLLGPILNISLLSVMQIIFLSSTLAILLLFIYAYKRNVLNDLKKITINKSLFFFLCTSGFSGILWLKSLTLLPIAQAILLYNITPIFACVLGFLFLEETISLKKIITILIGFSGVIILLHNNLGKLHLGNTFFLSASAVLLAAFLNAGQAVIGRKISLQYPLWITIFLIMLAEAIVAFPFAFLTAWHFTLFSVGSVIFLSIFSSIIAFYFYVKGLRILHSSTVTLIGYFEPLLVSLWGYLLLHQSLNTNIVLGGFFILLAGYFAIRIEEKERNGFVNSNSKPIKKTVK